MEDAALKDFLTYGLGTGVPLNTGHFLAQFCHREGGMAGAHLPDPVELARIIGISPPLSGGVDREALAAIVAFLSSYAFVTVESDDSLTLTKRGAVWWEHHNQPVPQEMLRPMLLAAGLGRVADTIVQESRPSIRLTARAVEDEDKVPLGASKLGGSPDLPRDYEWPRYGEFPLAFIAQINLSEVTPCDPARLLPLSGMLYFFLNYQHLHDAWPFPSGIQRVLYCCDDSSVLQRTPMPRPLPEWLLVWDRPHFGPYQPCSLTFEKEVTLQSELPWIHTSLYPELSTRFLSVAPFTETEKEAYDDVIHRLQGPAYNINRMLGHPDPIQGMYVDPDEVVLMQVDSEDDLAGMMWGDVGRIYWWMTKDELARLDFTNVKFDEQCS